MTICADQICATTPERVPATGQASAHLPTRVISQQALAIGCKGGVHLAAVYRIGEVAVAHQGVEAAGLVEVVGVLHVARAQAALQVQRRVRA